jgi:hypothetical protein
MSDFTQDRNGDGMQSRPPTSFDQRQFGRRLPPSKKRWSRLARDANASA